MTSRARLMAMLERKPVDRAGVNFYEIGGFHIDPSDPDPFNIYNHPSWQPLLQLAEERTDLIRMRPVRWMRPMDHPWHEFFTQKIEYDSDARFTRTTFRIAGRTMTQTDRRDMGLDTTWMVEHLLKDLDDLKAYLQLPDEVFDAEPDLSLFPAAEKEVGDRGIVMVDTDDPVCAAAQLFSMDTFTLIAYTETALFHQLLEKLARPMHVRTNSVAQAFPGHLWRIYGPEYVTEPYLPAPLFEEYVVTYTKPMVDTIKKHGGYPRIHCHGRIKNVLPSMVAMGADAIDPIEPPPQGDVQLADVRREYGADLVLFGNIEVSDIENLDPQDFEKVVLKALRDGTHVKGRGFVLMPSSCPYGREISARTLANYETMVRLTHEWQG
jgi:hypothetical protein